MKKILIFIIIFLLSATASFLAFPHLKTKIKNYLETNEVIDDLISTYLSYQKGTKDGFTFIVVGDTERKDGNLHNVFQKIIDQANQSKASFFIHLGDFTHQGRKPEYDEFKQYLDKNLALPYYIVPGNHDILQDKDNKNIFKTYFKKLYQSFDYNNTHFVILDNSDNRIGFDSEQLDWFKKDLAEHKENKTFIFMHRPINPPFVKNFNQLDGITKRAKTSYEEFINIVKNQTNILAIFTGHIHTYFTYTLEGIPVIISGGGGSEFNLPFWNSSGTLYHYLIVKMKKETYFVKPVEIKTEP